VLQAINVVAGSSWLRTANGQLVLFNPEGVECYRGKPTAEAVEAAFADEHPLVQQELINWLRRADVFGSGFHFKPVNSMQLAPKAKPAGGMRL